ncbi:MAG: response regulator [Chloroflexota bacterium]
MPDQERPILLIEDNPMDADLTRRAFAKRKVLHPIEVARDGEEALACLQNWESGKPLPIVILLDLKLPKLDGLEVLQYLKTHERFRSIPAVVLTTSNEDGDIQMAYQLGANSYIVKPVNFDEFMQVVDQIQTYWCKLNFPPQA